MALELIYYYYQAYLRPAYNRPVLSAEQRKRRDRRTPRIALRRYSLSPFAYMFASGDDQALLNCCGVDHKVFDELLDLFEPLFHAYTYDEGSVSVRVRKLRAGARVGRKKEFDAIGCLGLVLFWYRTRGSSARSISMAFGLTSTPMYKWLKFGRRILLCALQKHPDAVVKLPTEQEVERYIEAIGAKYPVLGEHRVWGACDGLKLNLQKSSNWLIQNKYYNGWTNGTYVNSCLVFAPDGRIRACTINCPGSWHDSTIADYGLYDNMEAVYDRYNAKMVVDSAFVAAKDYLVKSGQMDPKTPEEVVLNRAATSCRQLSEWGMRQIQGGFPRLKDNMYLEFSGERRIIFHLMVLLYNYQTSKVQINTIMNTFTSNTRGFFSYGIVPIESAEDFFQ